MRAPDVAAPDQPDPEGLHASVSSATMYAYYTGNDTQLADDDRAGIWSRYAAYSSPSGCGSLSSGQGLGAERTVEAWPGPGRA